MANRRMFSLLVIDTDVFLDLPLTSQALYFHLSMRADDDGFIGNSKKIRRMIGASEGDMETLIDKGFLLKFETGVCVVKHWRIHNYIQKDRYSNTIYSKEKELIHTDENKIYQEGQMKRIQNDSSMDTECIQGVNSVDTGCEQPVHETFPQVRLGKVSIDKVSIDNTNTPKKKKTFQRPKIEEIQTYCLERKNSVDSQKFYDYYESNGWKVGKNSMKDWKAAIRNWERNQKQQQSPKNGFYRADANATEEERCQFKTIDFGDE